MQAIELLTEKVADPNVSLDGAIICLKAIQYLEDQINRPVYRPDPEKQRRAKEWMRLNSLPLTEEEIKQGEFFGIFGPGREKERERFWAEVEAGKRRDPRVTSLSS